MLFNYLPDRALVPLSNSQSYPKFYAYLLERMLREIFSVDFDDEAMVDGSPTRNMLLQFIKRHIRRYAETNLNNGEYPSGEKDAYDLIKSSGWIIEDNVGMGSYIVDMTTSVRALGEFLIEDFQSVNQSESSTNITDGISGLLSSARSILSEETQDSDRLSQLRNTQSQVKKLVQNLNSIIREMRRINKDNLENMENRTSSEINNTFIEDFDKLVIRGYTTIDNIKNSPLTIETVIKDIKNSLYLLEEGDEFDNILSNILNSSPIESKEELLDYITSVVNDILKNITHIKDLRKRSEHHKEQMIKLYKNKMALRRIYMGKNNNYKEVIIRSLQKNITEDNAPIIKIVDNIDMYGPEALSLTQKKTEKKAGKLVGKQERNPDDIVFDEAKHSFNKIFSKPITDIFGEINDRMTREKIDILHSDDLDLNTIESFANLAILLKINPIKPLDISNLRFISDHEHRTEKKDWISFPSFYIEKIGE